MDTTSPQATGTRILAPTDERTALHLTPLQPTAVRSFGLSHPYVEIVYMPLVGPTSVLLLRYLGRLLGASRDPVAVCAASLAKELGLRARSDDPLGKLSSLRKAIDRLEHPRLVRWLDDNHLGIMTEAPAISDRTRAKLPPAARSAHDQFVRVVDLRDPRC